MNLVTKYLRKIRVAAGKSQRDVAMFLGHTTPQFVSNYERGLCGVSPEMAIKISEFLGGELTEIRWSFITMAADRFDEALAASKKKTKKRRKK